MEVRLGDDVCRLSWSEHGIREELLDQVGVVRLQERHQVSVHVLVDLPQQLIHFELLLAQLSQELVDSAVEVDEASADHSEVTMPVLLGRSLSGMVRRMRTLPGGLPLALPRGRGVLLLELWRLLSDRLRGLRSTRVRSVQGTPLVSVDLLLEWAHHATVRGSAGPLTLSALQLSCLALLVLHLLVQVRSAHQDVVVRGDGVQELLVVCDKGLLLPLDGIVVVHESLPQFGYGAAVILGVLLQINHVLFESLDEPRVVLFAHVRTARGVSRRVLWLEGLRHDGHAFLLHKLFDLRYLLRDGALGIVPDADGVILESRWHSIFVRKLEHFCLLLAQAVHGLDLVLLHHFDHVFEGALQLRVEAHQFFFRKGHSPWLLALAMDGALPVERVVLDHAARHDLLHVLFEFLLLRFQLIDEVVLVVRAGAVQLLDGR